MLDESTRDAPTMPLGARRTRRKSLGDMTAQIEQYERKVSPAHRPEPSEIAPPVRPQLQRRSSMGSMDTADTSRRRRSLGATAENLADATRAAAAGADWHRALDEGGSGRRRSLTTTTRRMSMDGGPAASNRRGSVGDLAALLSAYDAPATGEAPTQPNRRSSFAGSGTVAEAPSEGGSLTGSFTRSRRGNTRRRSLGDAAAVLSQLTKADIDLEDGVSGEAEAAAAAAASAAAAAGDAGLDPEVVEGYLKQLEDLEARAESGSEPWSESAHM